MPGRAHRDRDRLTADADLERLLDGDGVVLASPAGSRRASTRRVEYGGARLLTRSAYSRGEPTALPASTDAQLAFAQTAYTVIDQRAPRRRHLANRRAVDVVVVGERLLHGERPERRIEPHAAAEQALPGRAGRRLRLRR